MCTSMSGNKGMKCHYEVSDFATSCYHHLILPQCAASLLWWDGLFFEESQESSGTSAESFPPYLGIYFHALWRDAIVPWRNPSCYKKEVRIYFDNTIVVCWNHKGRGNLLDFFLELIYPMLLCTHISTVYLIGLKEWRLFCSTHKVWIRQSLQM